MAQFDWRLEQNLAVDELDFALLVDLLVELGTLFLLLGQHVANLLIDQHELRRVNQLFEINAHAIHSEFRVRVNAKK